MTTPSPRWFTRSSPTALTTVSGLCRLLNSYKDRITAGVTDVCLDCGVAPHSVEHLFQCPACPTQLTTHDLWNDPNVVADFLKLDNNWQKEGSCKLQQQQHQFHGKLQVTNLFIIIIKWNDRYDFARFKRQLIRIVSYILVWRFHLKSINMTIVW